MIQTFTCILDHLITEGELEIKLLLVEEGEGDLCVAPLLDGGHLHL